MPRGKVTLVKWPKPVDELAGIATYIKTRVYDAQNGMQSNEIFVGVPNRLWGKLLRKELEKREVPISPALSPRRLPGNPQKAETSQAMKIFTALCLAADEGDLVAWRSWFGFGDFLTNSALWIRLCSWCNERQQEPLEALEELTQNYCNVDTGSQPFLQAERLVQAYRRGKQIVALLSDKRGFALVKALEKEFGQLPEEFMQLVAPLDGVETASELGIRAQRHLFDPCFSKDGLRLGSYETAQYLEPKMVVLVGLINGFMPEAEATDALVDPNKRARLYHKQLEQLRSTLMRASEEVVLSCFTKEEMGRAGELKLNVSRIRIDHGVRMAIVAPSSFFDDMGPALPGAVSFL
jgi:DNA helicase-2/ATP-dependent DNA helicase PcrA